MKIYCDICGAEIIGEPVIIVLDRATLRVCRRCAQKYSKRAQVIPPGRARSMSAATTPKITTQMSTPRPVPRASRRVSTLGTPRELRYEIVEDFAERVKRAREQLGLTRELLARLVNEKESVIRRIEEGSLEPTIELARKLERVLKIKLLEPVLEEEEMESYVSKSRGFELTLGDVVVIREKKREK
ncbi:MAG: TIGR00270 family protein [Thermoprotei archaeon]|nr:MAG: TIGR00270 family protein [Thermoprotei archaeon]